MATLDALIEKVREAPDDDAPRLVLADVLQDRGDPWGEIIALSCRYASLDRTSAEAGALHERVLALRRLRWPTPFFVGTIVRGFFDMIWATDAGVAHVHGPEQALLRLLRVRNATDAGLQALASTPVTAHVDELRIEAAGPCSPAHAIAAVAHARCRVLRLRGLEVSADELAAMFAGPLGETIRHLDVSQRRTPVSAAFVWPALEALALSHALTDDDVATLLGHRQLHGLRSLDLLHNMLGDRAIEAVAATPFTRLASLRLRASEATTAAGIAALSNAAALQRLTALTLDWNHQVEIASEELVRLATFRHLTDLQLELSTRATALQALYAALDAPLYRLQVRVSGVGSGAVPPLERPAFAGLCALDLSHNALGDDGAARLARADLPQLETLDLSSCQIGPAGVRALAESPALPRGLQLGMYRNDLGPYADALRARFAKVDAA